MQPTTSSTSRGADRARASLVEAATRLLPEQAPSTISGRDLAAEAGVNYGLIHHYFGSKDAVLRAGLVALRTDFVATHDDIASIHLLTENPHPYLRALVRSHIDYPDTFSSVGEFPLGTALVEVVSQRLATGDEPSDDNEAKARVIAMVSIQLCYSVFGAALLDATTVRPHERPAVEDALATIYDSLALYPKGDST
jgi:TetR/AcrR family transcriptional regulator, repressor for neighboring sulfatase